MGCKNNIINCRKRMNNYHNNSKSLNSWMLYCFSVRLHYGINRNEWNMNFLSSIFLSVNSTLCLNSRFYLLCFCSYARYLKCKYFLRYNLKWQFAFYFLDDLECQFFLIHTDLNASLVVYTHSQIKVFHSIHHLINACLFLYIMLL